MSDTTLYHMEPLEDALGAGLRIQTTDGNLYEALEPGEYSSRIYGGEEYAKWHAVIKFIPDDVEEAYGSFSKLADNIEKQYGIDIGMTGKDFYDTVTAEETPRAFQDNITLTYLEEGQELDIPKHAFSFDSGVDTVLSGAFLGCVGGTLGAIALGPVLGPASGVSIQLGATVGAGLTGPVVSRSSKAAESFLNSRREKKYKQQDRMEQTLFEKLNERNSHDAYLEEVTLDEEKGQRRDELTESGIDETWETLRNIHFDQFSSWEGVNATISTDSYEEANRFVTAALNGTQEPLDRPTIYRNPNALDTFLNHLVFEDDDDVYVLDAGVDLVQQAMPHTEDDEAVKAVLEEYDAAVELAGEDLLKTVER